MISDGCMDGMGGITFLYNWMKMNSSSGLKGYRMVRMMHMSAEPWEVSYFRTNIVISESVNES